MFLDDDDAWRPPKIEVQLATFHSNPGVGLVYTGTVFVDRAERVLDASTDHLSGGGWPHILFRNFIGPTSAVAMRRELFDKVGQFDPHLKALQDYDLWIRLSKAAPINYDGAHNLLFGAHRETGGRIGEVTNNYSTAFDVLAQKYGSHLRDLNFWQRRRFRCQTRLVLAGKYFDNSEFGACLFSFSQAAALYPPAVFRVGRSAYRRARKVFMDWWHSRKAQRLRC